MRIILVTKFSVSFHLVYFLRDFCGTSLPRNSCSLSDSFGIILSFLFFCPINN